MKLVHTTRLTTRQKEAVRTLTEACRNAEPITLSAPSEDGLDYYLIYANEPDNSELTAFSFLFFVPQEDTKPERVFTCEYTAFVHPGRRRQGYFTEMLNAALRTVDQFESDNQCQVDFCFLTDEKSPAASAVLEAIGAEYWYSEYKMTRKLLQSDGEYRPALTIRQTDPSVPQGSEAASGLYAAILDGEVIGTCALLPCRTEIYLYAFQIKETYRSQGYGRDFLRGMLALLATEAGDTLRTVSVQVSGLNYIARNLYKKTGFRETESLSYYIY